MNDNIKKPILKGIAKVPMVMQLEALECGAACLAMILAYYNKWIPIEQVRADCGVSRDGSNALNIIKAAKHYGLVSQGYRCEPEDLINEGKFPCIIHWNFNHYVVLDGFKGGKAYLNDPAKGMYSIPMKDFDEAFTGICLEFEPGEDFVPSGKRKSVFSFAKRRLKGTERVIMFSILTGIITTIMGVINPAFSRIFIDRLLSGQNPGWLSTFLIILFGFNVIQIVMSAIQSMYNYRIKGKIDAVGSSTYFWKILNLPITFFSQRMAGDIQQRQISNASIAGTLIDVLAPLLLNFTMMIFYLLVMLRYSLILTLVGLVSISVNIILSNYISKKRINITRVAMRDSAKLNAATVSGIEMVETIKASGAEHGYFIKWSGYQAGVNAQNVKYIKLNQHLGMIIQFFTEFANTTVLILGVYLTMQGQFTVGMIMAFQGFLSSFMAPANMIISAGQIVMEMRTQMERIDDVMEYQNDDIFMDYGEIDYEKEECKKLSGNIEIKNIEFGYSPLAKPLIQDFNLNISSGKSIAIVGSSGCGKSTVSKLISGLFKPRSGEILFDGKPVNKIDSNVFHSSLAVVDQDIILFEDTITNNIKMWDESIEDFEMILAARDAQIHNDIMKRAGGYQHKIIEGGRDFSGGERQRLEIARVLAQDPTIIILDEATSALDAKTEYEVVKAIKNRGITSIVIAHRLSTIRSCDEIIVMDKGRIRNKGTHEELMETSEFYRELVIAE